MASTASSANSLSIERSVSATYLSVARSLTGRRWVSRLDEATQREAAVIAQSHGLEDILARVLAGRGIRSADVEAFLEPKLRSVMPDPSVLRDMDEAARRLADAIQRREHVAIFGDYDVDGATSSALLAQYLRAFGLTVDVHIPDRLTEGYGPNIPAIEALRAAGASLLVTVDCGVTSFEALEAAARVGLECVVLDHHQAAETLPKAVAVVNPNRQDDLSGLGYLAACGVVFLTLVALRRELASRSIQSSETPDLLSFLDIVALGTVADVVPLKGLNRAFVRQGLRVMAERKRVGLRALMDVARLDEAPQAFHLGFLLGPRINAGGRIGDAALGSRLLCLDDPDEAMRIATELNRLNGERQQIEQAAVEQAEAMVLPALLSAPNKPTLIVGSPDWHPGVVGLVAARLKERHRRPAIAIAWGEGGAELGTGSCRSITGVDIGRAVRRAVETGMLAKGGGHAMAAGLTIAAKDLPAFEAWLDEALSQSVMEAQNADSLRIDGALTAASLTPALHAVLDRAAPFGQGNAEPVIALPAHELMDVIPVGEQHLRLRLRSGDGSRCEAIAFRSQGQPLGQGLQKLRGRRVHVAGTVSLNRWQGREKLDLRVLDAAEA